MVNPEPDIESSLATDVTKPDAEATIIDDLVKNHSVMMFSKSTCAFCLELKRTLQSYGIPYFVFEVDKSAKLPDFIAKLNEISGIKTFPNLFINGKSHGGCMDMKKKEFNLELLPLFASIDFKNKKAEDRVSGTTFFWFPDTINKTAAQASGCIAAIICILCVIFWKRRATKWVVLGLAIDFFMRLLFGAFYTPIGVVSSILTQHKRPVLAAGPPKQFAAFCGFFMSCLSAGLLLANHKLGGTIVIGALIFPTALEGIFDYCLGCVIFGFLIKFNLVPASIYRPYLNLYLDKYWAWDFTHTQPSQAEAESTHVLLPGQTVQTKVDLVRKDRIETEYKLQDVHLIKHARIELFTLPMTLAALAFCFRLASSSIVLGTQQLGNWGTKRAFHAIGIFAAVVFVFFGILYIIRMIQYPKKVRKEWNHPLDSNMFSCWSITLVLFGYMMFNQDLNFGITLIWIAACFQMYLTIDRVSKLVYERVADDLLNPIMMIAPVANFICAFGFGAYHQEHAQKNYEGAINYSHLGRLWFAVAALFAIVLFTITISKAMRDHHSDVRTRSSIFIWMTTFSVAGPAYQILSGDSGMFYQSMWYLAIFFFAVNIRGYLNSFYTYPADMSIMIYAFSYCALFFSTFHYYSFTGDQFMRVLSIIALAIACISVSVVTLHFVFWLQEKSVFRPRPKWGPINFMKLTHEAFRAGLPNMVKWLNSFDDNATPSSIAAFADLFDSALVTYLAHGNHEEEIIFPAIRRYFPNLNPAATEDHHRQHTVVEKFSEALKKLRNDPAAESAPFIAFLKAEFPAWAEDVLSHLRSEEASISVVARKYIPIEVQRSITDRVFSLTPAEDWQRILPFTLASLHMPMWKSQFIKTFIWANPARAQELGLMLYRSVDSVTWASLAEEMPEIIPRGECGFRRAY
jgi:tellurite resistance protein TehA-like permease/glutaredoxin